ncbi:hypothetical protein GCM10029992_44710 [Glycomyces albus]
MIAVHVFLQCRPEARDDFIAALEALQATTLAQDTGCLHYRFYADLDDPTRFVCLEEWTDKASLDSHLAAAHHASGSAQIDRHSAREAEIRVFEAEPIDL